MRSALSLSGILEAEWKPAFGCTEPASVAWAAALAAHAVGGQVSQVHLRCDPRTYKNCYAVGLPVPEKRTGILWALAIGACLPSPDRGLRSFELADGMVSTLAGQLMNSREITVDVDPLLTELNVDVRVVTTQGSGRAVLEETHTRIVRLECDGVPLSLESAGILPSPPSMRPALAALSFQKIWDLVGNISAEDRIRLREGSELNLAIARHGLSILPDELRPTDNQNLRTRLAGWVGAGVHARMSGETLPVMSLTGSGNKGITVTVPIVLWGRDNGISPDEIDRALAFAILMTAATTHHLGTLSAICGAANAAGIGIASALVMMMGGNPTQVELAVHNIVGNLAGMICDGAKIGCAMKTMTGVDAAFRAAHMAMTDVSIPASDGIVGSDGNQSLANLGRIAQIGMAGVDREILAIMQEKLIGN